MKKLERAKVFNMVKGIQTSNGKAFEYVCVDAIYRRLSCDQEVVIEDTPQLRTAKEFFDRAPETLKDNIIKAADAASRVIIRLEPQLTFPEDNSPLFLSLQTDAMGQMGDVRDVLCIRKQNGWEIGFSCKHNHHAVKHSRLSGTIDFGKEWFDIPCSYEYFIEVRRLFDELGTMRKTSKVREKPILWSEVEDKAEKYYKPVLNAFMAELMRLDRENPNVIPERLVRYLIGRKDFYKVIADEKRSFTRVEAVNINGTLNQKSGAHNPLIKVPVLKLPNQFYHIGYKPGSDNTIQIVCNEGWEISMRIHSASSKVEPSLKFDVNLISLPSSIYAQVEPW